MNKPLTLRAALAATLLCAAMSPIALAPAQAKPATGSQVPTACKPTGTAKTALLSPKIRQSDAWRHGDQQNVGPWGIGGVKFVYDSTVNLWAVWNPRATILNPGTKAATPVMPSCYQVTIWYFTGATDHWQTQSVQYIKPSGDGSFAALPPTQVTDPAWNVDSQSNSSLYKVSVVAIKPGYRASAAVETPQATPYADTRKTNFLCYLAGTVNTQAQFLTKITPALISASPLGKTKLGTALSAAATGSNYVLKQVAENPGTSITGATRDWIHQQINTNPAFKNDRIEDLVVVSAQVVNKSTGKAVVNQGATLNALKTGSAAIMTSVAAVKLLAAVPSMQDAVYQHCTV